MADDAADPADLAKRFFKLDVEAIPQVSTRAEVVAQLAAWLDKRELIQDSGRGAAAARGQPRRPLQFQENLRNR